MSEEKKDEHYCTFCRETDFLREFKAFYVCEHCVEAVKQEQNSLKEDGL